MNPKAKNPGAAELVGWEHFDRIDRRRPAADRTDASAPIRRLIPVFTITFGVFFPSCLKRVCVATSQIAFRLIRKVVVARPVAVMA